MARERRGAAGLDPGAGRGQRHLAEAMVMAVGLAVGRDLDELGVRGGLVEAGQEACRQRIARAEEPVEGHGVGDRSVVEEERQLAAPAPFPPVGPARVQPGSGSPVAAGLAHAGGLGRREEREAHALLRQHLERLAVRGGLGEPHPVGLPSEAMAEVGQAPAHLGDLVATAAERQDRVPVRLRDGVPVPPRRAARPVSLQDRAVDVRTLVLEPCHQRGADVEREGGEVVHDVEDAILRVDPSRRDVRRVALGGDARIPVVKRSRGVLDLDALQPGTLARRLVEVPVDCDESGTAHE